MSAGYMKKCVNRHGQPKKAHATEQLADDQRRSLAAQRRLPLAKTNTYYCNQCGGYHVGELGRNNRGRSKRPSKNVRRPLDTQ